MHYLKNVLRYYDNLNDKPMFNLIKAMYSTKIYHVFNVYYMHINVMIGIEIWEHPAWHVLFMLFDDLGITM